MKVASFAFNLLSYFSLVCSLLGLMSFVLIAPETNDFNPFLIWVIGCFTGLFTTTLVLIFKIRLLPKYYLGFILNACLIGLFILLLTIPLIPFQE